VNSLPKTVTRQRHGYDLNPGPSAPQSSVLTTQLPSHPYLCIQLYDAVTMCRISYALSLRCYCLLCKQSFDIAAPVIWNSSGTSAFTHYVPRLFHCGLKPTSKNLAFYERI